ncbi:MAG: hypothetical protein RMJ55_17395, partial [Roseiflexaceae bacterium]|nr:hypothetical protein [Roseiflexaceae bacterium]
MRRIRTDLLVMDGYRSVKIRVLPGATSTCDEYMGAQLFMHWYNWEEICVLAFQETRPMTENPADDLVQTLRTRGAHYVIGAEGRPIAVLLTLEEYEHYLDLLDDEADSQDEEIASRLAQ